MVQCNLRELADVDHDGKLSFDEFVCFVQFVNEKIEKEKEFGDEEMSLLVEEYELLVEENHRLTTKANILMKKMR